MSAEIKQYEDDDGRVICNMDVDGMPWHDRRARGEQTPARATPQRDPMTKAEALGYTWNAVLAGLAIVGVFAVTWVLLILFCIYVWFR